MKSSLTMTLTPDLEPAIKVYYEQDINEDLRDRVFGAFRENLGFNSSWCTVEFAPSEDNKSRTMFIKAVHPKDILQEYLRMENILKTEMPELYEQALKQRNQTKKENT